MKRPVSQRAQMKGVVPFLDLLFVLLFSLLALSDSKTSADNESVRIQLPDVEPTTGTAGPQRPAIILQIDADSVVRMAGRPEPLDTPKQLDALLETRLGARNPDEFDIEIHGDARARHGVGVALLQHLRNKGFGAVSLLAVGDKDAGWRKEAKK